jgi:hypothetical protein
MKKRIGRDREGEPRAVGCRGHDDTAGPIYRGCHSAGSIQLGRDVPRIGTERYDIWLASTCLDRDEDADGERQLHPAVAVSAKLWAIPRRHRHVGD